jgi:hypothetical protein
MFIKLTNGVPETYTIGQLRKDNPNVSFPKDIPLETLASYNVYPLTVADRPIYNNLIETTVLNTPTEVNGAWIQSYSVVQKSQEDAERNIREQRNFLLSESDWTQVEDAPVDKTVWATYRQALRDITTQEGFPFNVTFPNKPTI